MKTKIITVVAILALSLSLVFAVACTSQPVPDSAASSTATATDSMPAMQPADHEGRSESGVDMCYSCHGNGSKGNPNDSSAAIIPEDHYVNGSYDSKELDQQRNQCITCHLVTK